jgi:hypothetical protein
VIDADPEPIEEVVMQVPEHEEVSGGEDEQAGEALSINAEPTFRPLDFEDPPPHDNEAEMPAVEFEVPEVGVEAPKVEAEALAPEPTPAKKSKRKADGKQDDQPLLF